MEKAVPAQKMDSVVRLWVESKPDSTAPTEVQIPHDFYDREISWVTDEKEIRKVGIILWLQKLRTPQFENP